MGKEGFRKLRRTLSFTDDAKDDIVKIGLFIADASGSNAVAEEFIQKLADKCVDIAELGGTLGTARPELDADLRSFPYKNYMIFFRYQGNHMEIINILNGSRDVAAHFDN